MTKPTTHHLNGDVIYCYDCPEKEYMSLKNFNNTIDWSKVKYRGQDKESGRSFIPEANSLHLIPQLSELHAWVSQCINDTRSKLSWREETIPELAISQSWLNRSDTGEKHHKHIHPLSILSGILYLTEPAETEFISPSIYALPPIIAPDKSTQFTSNTTIFKARMKTLIVFPSTLKHGVGPNLEAFSRYTFSVNTWIKGSHGCSKELAFIPEKLD